MRKNLILSLLALAASLTACTPASEDRYGVYADGSYYIAVNHAKSRIHFRQDAHPEPEILLAESQNGKGFGFKTWRNKESCGLEDDKGNVFLLPRLTNRLERDGVTYRIKSDNEALRGINGGNAPAQSLITATVDDKNVLAYAYDTASGVRYIDRFQDGAFDRRLYLENGVGFLAHCRGFSLDDYR